MPCRYSVKSMGDRKSELNLSPCILEAYSLRVGGGRKCPN